MIGSYWIQKLTPYIGSKNTDSATQQPPGDALQTDPPKRHRSPGPPRLAPRLGGPRQRTDQVGILAIDASQFRIQVVGALPDFLSTRLSRRRPLPARRQLLAQRYRLLSRRALALFKGRELPL